MLRDDGAHSIGRSAGVSGAQREANSHHPVSIPSTLTVIRMGNGEIQVALVMSGTVVRPFSDEVWG